MTKGKLVNNTKTRRKGSMLQDRLSKIKYLFVLAVFLVLPILPMQAMAGISPARFDSTDVGTDGVGSVWDTRTRDTFIQVTNTSASTVGIHVQLFNVGSSVQECEPCDFPDVLTPHDTHVYNIEDIVRNIDGTPRCPIGEGTYGSMVISLVGGGNDQNGFGPLIGMFRIIDELGYEYRTNSAGKVRFGDNGLVNPFDSIGIHELVNFSAANGHNLSDFVGIAYVETSPENVVSDGVRATFGGVGADPALEEIMLWDENEIPTSCGSTTFTCAVNEMDKAIDNSLPNSKGENNRICSANTLDFNDAGWVDMPFAGFSCTVGAGGIEILGFSPCIFFQPFFVGFLGLNNGDGTGSMDSWWVNQHSLFYYSDNGGS